MKKVIFLFINLLCLSIFFSCVSTVKPVTLNKGILTIGKQITESMRQDEISSIAILDFSNLEGNVDQFGRYLFEGLIFHIFQVPGLTVVERNQLSSVLKELQLQNSGLIDSSSMKELGKMLGVDALLLGTITDLGKSIEINGRIVKTETTSIVAVTSVEVMKDGKVANLSGVEMVPHTEAGIIESKDSEDQGNKVFFRSSGIEMWSTGGDFSKLLSNNLKHSDQDGDRQLAMNIEMEDSGDEIIFNSYDASYNLANTAGKMIDIMKIDLGSGQFSIDSPDSELRQTFQATCVILIDESILDRGYYVSTDDWSQLGNGSEMDYPEVIKILIRENKNYLDANGAILFPFQAFSLSSEKEKLMFSFQWNNINDVYSMDVKAFQN